MLELFRRLFASDQFMPHGHCYLWRPALVWLHVISDALILAAYITIPITLVYFIRRRRDLPFSSMFVCFGVFIIACGATHGMEIWTLWTPVYWLSGTVKVITACASVPTAIILMRLVPKALAIPSPAALREANEALRSSLREKEAVLNQLRQVQRELLDASRRAGMADVATAVIHNVGNALAGANVSASVIADVVKSSKQAGLAKAVELLRQRQGELAQFLSEDERGKQLPEYLTLVSDAIDTEHKQILKEMQSLNASIDHIKVIIMTQQSYAKSAGLIEKLPVTAMIEDALKLGFASFERHQINIKREFAEIPEVEIDRHKLFQILMNLISNARHALKDSTREEKNIFIRTKRNGGTVLIEVEDNGCGIAAENLSSIFRHGFTTKKEGHGFGLHASANTATEIGGKLIVRSAGINQGATFTLEIPLTPPAVVPREAA
jgi:C4-dicarboxylate-specific signal transduction histidine kinase